MSKSLFDDDFFRDFDHDFVRTQKRVFRGFAVGVLLWAAFWIAVIVVAIHFLVKFW